MSPGQAEPPLYVLGRDLRQEMSRLSQHIYHLSSDDIRALEGMLEELQKMHTSQKSCIDLCKRHKDKPPPWGTRYAGPVERLWRRRFPNAWP